MIILDRATWHTQTPGANHYYYCYATSAASPELNPTEQVWQALRDELLANRCFEGYEDELTVLLRSLECVY